MRNLPPQKMRIAVNFKIYFKIKVKLQLQMCSINARSCRKLQGLVCQSGPDLNRDQRVYHVDLLAKWSRQRLFCFHTKNKGFANVKEG